MKKLLCIIPVLLITGCAYATPVDPFIPAHRPSPATTKYLGHMWPTNNFGDFFSVSEAKYVQMLIPARKMELEGLYFASKAEVGAITVVGDKTSMVAWGGITAILTACGVALPRPQEKANVTKALHTPAPEVMV